MEAADPPADRINHLPLALYAHIPWCVRKCPYCDFNSHAYDSAVDEKAYVNAMLMDLDQDVALVSDRKLDSIFIGGGTPSLVAAEVIGCLLHGISDRLRWAGSPEITLEANPGTVDAGKFVAYREAGVSRLSIGVQSFDNTKLSALGRIHSREEAEQAYSKARTAGFGNINLDLMFGLPGQSVAQALADLDAAIALNPEHLSWYQLTIEPNTLFHHQPPMTPDDELLWEMQQLGQERLTAAGYHQYEVSAYAKAGFQCRHNINYWSFGDYLGIGAGAHGKLTAGQGVLRTRKERNPRSYAAAALESKPVAGRKWLTKEDLALEFMLNALRLTEGVPAEVFVERTGLPLADVTGVVQEARDRGLMSTDATRLQPTGLGRRFLNDLVAMFV